MERWAIQELRLWEGPYHEPTPAGSVRRLKNWNKEGRFLEAGKLHQTKNVNIKFICPQPGSGMALTSLPNALAQETKIENSRARQGTSGLSRPHLPKQGHIAPTATDLPRC